MKTGYEPKKSGGFMWFFIIGFLLCVVGGVVWLKAEDNGYSKLAKGVDEYNKMTLQFEKQVSEFATAAKVCGERLESQSQVLSKLQDKVQMLEMRLDAEARRPHQDVAVAVRQAVKDAVAVQKQTAPAGPTKMVLEMPAHPIQIIYREGPPAKFKAKKPTPLLEKSGVIKKGANGAHPSGF